jgi:hypothetical protein
MFDGPVLRDLQIQIDQLKRRDKEWQDQLKKRDEEWLRCVETIRNNEDVQNKILHPLMEKWENYRCYCLGFATQIETLEKQVVKLNNIVADLEQRVVNKAKEAI